jgi:hypothetical protein
MRMHAEGLGWGQLEPTHLAPHIPRDELDGGLHFGYDPLGFLETIQTRLAETFLLGHITDRINMTLDITRNELAVATHAALHVDKVVGVADGADALGDRLALPSEALVLLTSDFYSLPWALRS